ncbi:MAG: putative lipid II flippase FtsW [Candidatus Levybacteria bacterium]|nr:putative lipid II flippase FtsW [Candidatus Levybacteria bacterium]
MKRLDFFLLTPVVCLVLFSLLMLYDASSFVALRDFNDKYHYVKEQFVWMILGFSALTFAYFFDYKKYYNLTLPALIVSLVLLLLVFVPGIGISLLGAKRWISLGFFVLQPAEFAKIALALYLSAWFSAKEKGRLLAFLLLIGFVIFLIMLQPDMGTAFIILSEAMAIYFISGASIFHILALIPPIIIGGIALIKIEPYRAARLATFLNPQVDLENSSYHIKQVLIALGSGGLLGVGLGNSLQKYAYLPESTTDSIFAIIAEEVGFIGASIVVLLFVVICVKGFLIASNSKDLFGKLLASGITTYITVQSLVNLGSQTALLPLTGVPLPFVSYGGSALIAALFAVGILLNISKQSKT